MTQLMPNTFSSYSMSPEVAVTSQIFTNDQRCMLQNHLALCAQEKLNLMYDPDSPFQSVQEESFKQGQISILQFLLDSHDTAVETLREASAPPEEQSAGKAMFTIT